MNEQMTMTLMFTFLAIGSANITFAQVLDEPSFYLPAAFSFLTAVLFALAIPTQ